MANLFFTIIIILPLIASGQRISTVFQSKVIYNDGILRNQLFSIMVAIACSPSGSIFIGDQDLNQIFSISPERLDINSFAGYKRQSGMIKEGFGEDGGMGIISSLAFDSKGFIFAGDLSNGAILKISPDGEVKIFAGGKERAFLDGPINIAKFNSINGLCLGPDDSIYVADNHRIRKISTSGSVSTLAGRETSGYKNGPGQEALFYSPYGLEFDQQGNLIIVDSFNHAIRKMNSTGYVSTITGSGKPGFRDGELAFALFTNPYFLTIDKGGLIYISERRNNVIRRISTEQNSVITVIGDRVPGFFDGLGKEARLYYPLGICMGRDENLYILDTNNRALRVYDPKLDIVSTIARSANTGVSDGYGSNALFNFAYDLTNDKEGNLFISDRYNSAIRKITLTGEVTTYAGLSGINGYVDGFSYEAVFYATQGLIFDNLGNLYVLDFNNNAIRIIDPTRKVSTFKLDGDKSFQDLVKFPNSIAKGLEDNIYYFSDYFGDRIWRLNISARTIEPWVGDGTKGSNNGFRTAASLDFPKGLCMDPQGNLWFGDYNHLIRKVDQNGQVTTMAGAKADVFGYQDGNGTVAKFYLPNGLACDKFGNVYVTDTYNYAVRKVTTTGQVSTVAGNPNYFGIRDGIGKNSFFNYPSGILSHPNGNVYVADAGQNFVREINVTTGRGKIIAGFGAPYYPSDTLHVDYMRSPQGIAMKPNTGEIFIADTKNNLVLVLLANDSKLEIYAGLGSIGWYDNSNNLRDAEFYYPHGLAFSQDGESLFVADAFNHVIRRITQGKVETVAGTGFPGLKDGPLLNATFYQPKAVVCDGQGNLYVADTLNHVIRKINLATRIVSTVVGNPNGIAGFKDGKAPASQLSVPTALSLASDDSVLFIAEYANHAIRSWNIASNTVKTLAGTGYPGFQDGNTNATFRYPSGLAFDNNNNLLYISDTGNHAIRVIDLTSNNVSTLYDSLGKDLRSQEYLYKPAGIVLDQTAKQLLILEAGKNAIRKINLNVSTSSSAFPTSNTILIVGVVFGVLGATGAVVLFLKTRSINAKVTKQLDLMSKSSKRRDTRELSTTLTITRTGTTFLSLKYFNSISSCHFIARKSATGSKFKRNHYYKFQ